MDLNDLKQERTKLIRDMRSINDKIVASGKDLSGAEFDQYQNMEKRLHTVNNHIKRGDELEHQQRLEAASSQSIIFDQDGGIVDSIPGAQDMLADDVKMLERLGLSTRHSGSVEMARQRCDQTYVSNFWAIQRMGKHHVGPDVHGALQVGTSSEGGHLVPTEYDRELVLKKKLFNEIRQVATVMTTAADINIPIEADEGSASWMAEEGTYVESDSSFGQVVLGSYKLGRIMKVSEELMQDSFFNMAAYIADAYGRAFGLAEEEAFVAGDGSGKPTGIIPSASVGVTAAGATAVTADECIDLFYALGRPYRARAVWLTSDTMIKTIRKLKDSDGQYLWQPGLQAGEPDRLLGRPIITSSYVPAPTTGNRSLAFGDMSLLSYRRSTGYRDATAR